ncbi:MAG: FAD-binding protein, partial [Chloroflexi bacterium]|nr:FAD-binding protein [Chloroflexota bacterium]
RTVRAEPGLLWGELDRETQAFGLAVTGGQISHTGIAGLTLGGGLGWLMRKHGLPCDNLLSVDVVTADGDLLTASASENPDLFWGVRGGGGNFGVVTSYEYQLHPLGLVLGGLIAFPLPEAPAVLRAYRDYMRTTPDELTTVAAFLTSPDGHPIVGIAVCYAGDLETGAKLVEPIRGFGTVVMEQVGPMPYAILQGMLDASAEPGRRFYMRSNFLNDLDDGAIDLMTEAYGRTPSPLNAVIIIQMGGAVSRVARESTAFYHRDAAYSLSILGGWLEPQGDTENTTWARSLWDTLQPHAASGVYVNELGAGESEERIKAAYGGSTYDRLVALKTKYDPANFFRLNQNIPPSE